MSDQPVFDKITIVHYRDDAIFGQRQMRYMLPPPERLITSLYKFWKDEYNIDLWECRHGKRDPYEKVISAHILYERGLKIGVIAKVIGKPRNSVYYMLRTHDKYIRVYFDYQVITKKCLMRLVRAEYGYDFRIKLK